jgi:hypothetical protein
MKSKNKDSGKLRIGDDWNAIRIIALSQSNPLKAIAEFVENSIDAHAKTITIIRGREHGAHYLSIKDDGDGVPCGSHSRALGPRCYRSAAACAVVPARVNSNCNSHTREAWSAA